MDGELRHAEIYLTWACDLNCPTCVQRGFADKHRGILPIDRFGMFLDRLDEQGVKLTSLEFNGGEPRLCGYLPDAVKMVKAKQPQCRICVLTNGVHAKPEDFDGIDLVRCTNYGAINRKYILRLQDGLGRKRFKSSWVVHREVELHGPKRSEQEAWPARCSSPAISLGPDGMVYACGANAIEQQKGFDLSENFIEGLRSCDPRRQERCLNCPSNHRLTGVQYGDKDLMGLVVEFGIWGTPVGFILHLPHLKWWRWRYLWSRYYRRPA